VVAGRGPETCIVLALNAKARDEVECIAANMSAIPPTVLLFLNQLRALTIDEHIVLDDESGATKTRHKMWREDQDGGIVVLHDNDATTRWRLTRRLLTCDDSTPPRGDTAVSNGATTEIAIAMQMESPTDPSSAV